MAFNCIRQHGGKSRTLINTLWSNISKGQLLALHGGELIAGESATAGDILVSADADVVANAEWGFAIIDSTMEYEADLVAETEVAIPAGTMFAVQSGGLTVGSGSGFFLSTEDAQPKATKVIGKFVDLPGNI